MQVFKGYAEVKTQLNKPIVTVGNFDGVHLGHQKIIKDVVSRARKEKKKAVVYTFRPHPQVVVSKDSEISLLTTYEEKIEILESLGVDIVIEEPFTRDFSTINPEDFFAKILIQQLGTSVLYVGYDFGFGKGRSGSISMLETLCKRDHIEFHVAKPKKVRGEVCSSSHIRNALSCGDIKTANRLLGYAFSYWGTVVHGDRRGIRLGFPTANLEIEKKLVLKNGVYATSVLIDAEAWQSVTNIGTRPTFHLHAKSPVIIETHILDFNRQIYGDKIKVVFHDRIRDEMKFKDLEQLKIQIEKDVLSAKKYR